MPFFFDPPNIHQVQYVRPHQAETLNFDQAGTKRLNDLLTWQTRSTAKPNFPPAFQPNEHMNHQVQLIADNSSDSSTEISKGFSQPLIYYTTEFGYERLPETLDGLRFLLADDAISFFDHPPDLANFLNAVYEQFGEDVVKAIVKAHILPRSVSNRHYHESLYGRPDRMFYNSQGELVFFAAGSPNADGNQPPTESVYYPKY
jgi:hypothetical protein